MKLVLTDMDGTLLNDQKEMPKEFFELVGKLNEKGIRVGVASGRQYFRLRKQFESLPYKLIYISENGASVYDGDKLLISHVLDEKLVLDITNDINKIDGIEFILAGLKASYIISDKKELFENAKMYCEYLKKFDSVEDILKEDKIVKVAALDLNHQAQEHISLFTKYQDKCHVVVSAKEWIDFNGLGVNKGLALKEIKKLYNLSDKDVVVFGDYNNDIEILKEAYYSYAMANATKEVKEVSNFTCLSNNDNGVCLKIKELFML